MVFGWGKKKEKQEVQTTPLEKQTTLSEVNKITKEVRSLREKTLIAEAKSFQKITKSGLDELLKIIKRLEKDNLKVDDIDKHLKTLVVRGKSQVISTINREAALNFDKINSYDDVLKFDKEIGQILKKIGDVLGRQSRVIHIFAKKYAGKLKSILATLVSNAKELHTLLENFQNLEEKIISINDDLSQISQNKNQKDIGEKRLDELNQFSYDAEEKIISLQNDIEKLKTSTEYSKFLEIKNNLENLELEKQRIKNEIDDQFTKISRPLTKYGYITSLEKPQKILMEKLIQNPIDVLNVENKSDIVTILQAARKGIQSGSVSVKDTDKSVIYIDETTGVLDNFIHKLSEFNSKKDKLENELKVATISDLEKKQSELSKITNDKNDLQTKIQNIEDEISESKTKIS